MLDLNQRPRGYEPPALPDCANPLHVVFEHNTGQPQYSAPSFLRAQSSINYLGAADKYLSISVPYSSVAQTTDQI